MKATVHHFVRIDDDRLRELAANAESTNEECCGFLLGHDVGERKVITVLPASNVSAGNRSIRFEVDPLEYLRAEQYADANQMELLGIYHSHPNGPAIPSETDRREAQPHFSYVILGLTNQRFRDIRSWRLNHQHQFEEETVIH